MAVEGAAERADARFASADGAEGSFMTRAKHSEDT